MAMLHRKRKKNIIVIAVLLACTVYPLLFVWFRNNKPAHDEFIYTVAVIIMSFVALGSLGFLLFESISHLPSIELKKRIITTFILFVFLCLVISMAIISLTHFVMYFDKNEGLAAMFNLLMDENYPQALRQLGVWVLVAALFLFYSIWNESVNREQKVREENLKFRYRILKSHVNPHFLFNSLNTLAELIYQDTKKADNYIQKLSGIYRYALENEENDLIALDKEINFVKEYFKLEQERVDDKVILEVELDNTKDCQIIPVSLQILVENAIKHNSYSHENPLEIKISQELGYIVVANNIRKKSRLGNSLGSGLENLKKRSSLCLNKEVLISNQDGKFIVKVPTIKSARNEPADN